MLNAVKPIGTDITYNMKSKPAENRLRLQRQASAKKSLRLRKKFIIQAGKVLFISLK